uniref:Dolichol phosphate-mannose biosynthesis regulatory protein n=1 Tax=Meloidogyne enterolobii TaxID=390850 RepID=A0A6V7VZ36_MELEN|nr:unnamed protein product [Meloidogyne enterolobii]
MDTSKTISCANVCFYLSIGLFVYYTLWIFGVPFIPVESHLRLLFPSQVYAMIIPLFLFWMVTFIALLIFKFR